MPKNPIPVISHMEIYSRTLRSIDAEIEEWNINAHGNQALLNAAIAPLKEKREALAYLYHIESGSTY